jgi:hypothetical protein
MIRTTNDATPETMDVMDRESGVETKKSAKLMKAFIVLNIARFFADGGPDDRSGTVLTRPASATPAN